MRTARLARWIAAGAFMLLTATSLAACSSEPATTADGRTKIRVATTVTGPTYWPYYYTPEVLGFYEEEGLEVEIVPINTGVTQSLLSGQIDIGGAGFDYMQQAGKVEGLNWYMMTDRYLFGAVVLADSGYDDVADLSGKKIGINEPNDSFDADFVLAANGLETGDYELVPVGESAVAAKALVAGEVDALVIPAGSAALRAQEAVTEQLQVLDTPASNNFYNTGLMATEEFLDEHRDIAVSFGRAIAKALIWMNANPQATAEMVMQLVPDAETDVPQAITQVQAAIDWNAPIFAQHGKIDPATFEAEIAALVKAKLIEEPYDAAGVYDESLFDEIWDFDVDAVTQAAIEGNWDKE